jgi:hypothetical protein
MLHATRSSGGARDFHSLFFRDITSLILAFSLEEMFPPVRDSEDSVNAPLLPALVQEEEHHIGCQGIARS